LTIAYNIQQIQIVKTFILLRTSLFLPLYLQGTLDSMQPNQHTHLAQWALMGVPLGDI